LTRPPRTARPAGQLPVRLGLEIEHHLQRGVINNHNENCRHRSGRHLPGDQRTAKSTQDQPRRQMADDIPTHRAVGMMGAHARQRSKDNGRHRGTERQMHDMLRRKVLRCEDHEHEGHQRQTATHPEQTGDKTTKNPQQGVSQPPDCHYCPINSWVMKAHSASDTGVIDSRLPRARRRMLASSGWARSSASGM
jgi:hypothetical protein